MLAVHLNDNDINRDAKFMYDLLDVFGLGENDLIDINRSKQENQKFKSPKGTSYGNINYKERMKAYLGF